MHINCAGLLTTTVFAFGLGCGASVGTDDCTGTNIACELPNRHQLWASADAPDLPTKNLPELTPRWIRELPMLSDEPDELATSLLTRGADNDLVLFTSQRRGIAWTRIDSAGEGFETGMIRPPSERRVGDASRSKLDRTLSSGSFAIRVEWPIEIDDGESSPFAVEFLNFGADLTGRPRRILDPAGEILWGTREEIYVVTGGGDRALGLEKRDGDMKLLWRQSAFERSEGRQVKLTATMLPDEQLEAFVWPDSDHGECSIYLVTELGNASGFASMLAQPGHDFPAQSPTGAALVASNAAGDLSMLRMKAPLSFTGVKFLRDSYTPLSPYVTALDPEGNIYTGLISGGREQSDQRPTVCKLGVEGDAACYVLPSTLEPESSERMEWWNLAALSGGELYIRSKTKLVRVDFPN